MKHFPTFESALEYARNQARGLRAEHYISEHSGGFWVSSYKPSEGIRFFVVRINW